MRWTQHLKLTLSAETWTTRNELQIWVPQGKGLLRSLAAVSSTTAASSSRSLRTASCGESPGIAEVLSAINRRLLAA